METYYMINYAFKYLELLDTVFLALKKKPLGALYAFPYIFCNLFISSVLARLPSLRYRYVMFHAT